MKRFLFLAPVLLFSSVDAAVPHDVCVSRAIGVPLRGGPPNWWDATTAGGDPSLDDPRWNQSTAQSFESGTAKAPLHTRALWTSQSGQEVLLLSFLSDLSPNQTTTARDVFLGFHRAHPDTKGTADPSDDEHGYILQIHLAAGGTGAAQPITYCGRYSACPVTQNWWRAFLDANGTGQCPDTGHNGHHYSQFNGGSNTTAPFTWLDNRVHFWKDTNRWAIQLRIPIAAANAPLSAGIEKGSAFWYEATMVTTVPYASIAKWPLASTAKFGVTTSICPQPSTPDFLIHEELGTVDATNCPLCSPDKFSKLTTDPGATPPTDCDTGLTLLPSKIGAVFNSTGPFDNVALTNEFHVEAASSKNTVVAQVVNADTANAFSGKVQARFRLANWGATAFNPGSTDTGTWDDIPGGAAVCLGGGTACTLQSIPAGGQKAIFFDWTIGSGAAGASEYCGYGLQPPGGSCTTTGCPTDQIKATGATTCVKIRNSHQCMYVELTSPNGEATFLKSAAFNNMNFGQMSLFAREALIDARGLPAAPGQPYQDIYLFTIPRNMPASVPPTTTVQQLVQQNAYALATKIADPYRLDIERMQQQDPGRLAEILKDLEAKRPRDREPPAPHHANDQEIMIRSAMRAMPPAEFERVQRILAVALETGTAQQIVHDAVTKLGPSDAAAIVPTLEIYPYFQPLGVGKAYQPMTSFTVFLSHENTLAGMHYEIDGAVRAAENIYHMRIPTGYAKRIQVRAIAIEPASTGILPGNPHWPCTQSGGCSCGSKTCGLVGTANLLPGLLAFLFVMRRRQVKSRRRTPSLRNLL